MTAGLLAMSGAQETAQADTNPVHREATPTFTITSQDRLAPASDGINAEAASLNQEGVISKDEERLARSITSWIDPLSESGYLLRLAGKKQEAPGVATDWHGILASGFEQRVGSDGKYYLLAKDKDTDKAIKLTYSHGRFIGKQKPLGNIKLIAGPRPGVLSQELVVGSPSNDPKLLQEYSDQLDRDLLTPAQVKQLHFSQHASFCANELYGKYLSDPNSPFKPDQSTRQIQCSIGNLEAIGTVSTNLTQGIKSVWLRTRASKENHAMPIGGASGAPLIVKYQGKNRIAGLLFAVNTLQAQSDSDHLAGGQDVAMVAAALNTHKRFEKIGAKDSSRVIWHVVYNEKDIPGYVTPAVAEAQAKETFNQQEPQDFVRGITEIPGIGNVRDAMFTQNADYKLITVGWVDPETGEPKTKAFKYEDFVLDGFNDDGSDQVNIDKSSNQIDHQQSAFVDSYGNHLGELTDAYYTGKLTDFKIYVDKNGNVQSIPTQYFGAN